MIQAKKPTHVKVRLALENLKRLGLSCAYTKQKKEHIGYVTIRDMRVMLDLNQRYENMMSDLFAGFEAAIRVNERYEARRLEQKRLQTI